MDSSQDNHPVFHGTTILSVRRQTPSGIQVAIGGDGQVTLGNIVVKGTARKVRKLYHGKVLAGFAGATADAFTLFERFEAKLEKHQGNLTRAAVELTRDDLPPSTPAPRPPAAARSASSVASCSGVGAIWGVFVWFRWPAEQRRLNAPRPERPRPERH